MNKRSESVTRTLRMEYTPNELCNRLDIPQGFTVINLFLDHYSGAETIYVAEAVVTTEHEACQIVGKHNIELSSICPEHSGCTIITLYCLSCRKVLKERHWNGLVA